MEHAKEMLETAKETLKDFSTQKMQLQKFIDQMTDWLTKVEETLLNCAHNLNPEALNKVKVGAEENEYAFSYAVIFGFFIRVLLSITLNVHLIKNMYLLHSC